MRVREWIFLYLIIFKSICEQINTISEKETFDFILSDISSSL